MPYADRQKHYARIRDAGFPDDFVMTPLNIRARAKFFPMRTKIVRRDNNKCMLCLGNDKLHVHHILTWGRHPSLRFNPENLITLCEGCHVDIAHSGNIQRSVNPVIANILLSLVSNENCPVYRMGMNI